jgi:hypothetical protein
VILCGLYDPNLSMKEGHEVHKESTKNTTH